MNPRLFFALLGTCLFACGDSDPAAIVSGDTPDAGPGVDAQVPTDTGAPIDTAAPRDTAPPLPVDDCSGEAKLVYVVDEAGMLASFQPDTLTFTDIGQLACESGTPFSMSVDRMGNAWVLYSSGKLYRVSTKTTQCTPIARSAGDQGFNNFGMGFVAVDGLASQDRLYIAGTPPLDLSFNFQTALGVIDPTTLATQRIAGLPSDQPELTGTGDGKLWAFYAQNTPPSLSRLDVTSGASLEDHPLPNVGDGSSARAWAFAFWGGDFWLFLQNTSARTTTVYQVEGDGFAQTAVIPDTGRTIVGAGVSTCAPLVLR